MKTMDIKNYDIIILWNIKLFVSFKNYMYIYITNDLLDYF